MADVADDATVTRFTKWEEEYSIEDVDRLAFLRIDVLNYESEALTRGLNYESGLR